MAIAGWGRATTAQRFDEQALFEACRNGDDRAWSQIVNRYERLVYAVPLKEGLSREDAADVAQETFAALMTAIDSINQPERLGYWLLTVARRLSWRQRAKGRDVVPLDDGPTPAENDLSAEAVRALWVYEAIQDLGEPCRSIVLGLFFDPTEPSYEEIAVRIGRPLGSVGPLRSRCLERLRRNLEGTAQ